LKEVARKISEAENVKRKWPGRIARINDVIGKIKITNPSNPGGYDNLSRFYNN